MYAHLGGAPLSVPAFQDAVRAGRTVVTNGPWLTFDVDGHGPGAVLDRAAGDRLAVRARVRGAGARTLAVVGPDGVVAEADADAGLHHELTLDGPTWLAAVARGPGHPQVLDASAFAHTSPVHVDVGGQRVARAADARWCLAFLDTFESFVRRHGRTGRSGQLGDLAELVERARAVYRGVLDRAQR